MTFCEVHGEHRFFVGDVFERFFLKHIFLFFCWWVGVGLLKVVLVQVVCIIQSSCFLGRIWKQFIYKKTSHEIYLE